MGAYDCGVLIQNQPLSPFLKVKVSRMGRRRKRTASERKGVKGKLVMSSYVFIYCFGIEKSLSCIWVGVGSGTRWQCT